VRQRTEVAEAFGDYSLISLPLGHEGSAAALQMAADRGAMKPVPGKLSDVRAVRMRTKVGERDRTLVVVGSEELLEGQKRGNAATLHKAKKELRKFERQIEKSRITHSQLEQRVRALNRWGRAEGTER